MTDGDRETLLLRVALDASRRIDGAACFEAIARGGLALLGGRFAIAYRVSASGEDLECVAAVGQPAGEGDPPGSGALESEVGALWSELAVLDAGLIRHFAPVGPAVLADSGNLLAPQAAAGVPELGPGLLVPLGSSSGPAGLLLICARRGETLPDAAVEDGRALAREIVPALDNVRSVASLRDLVIRDDTADCYNRRFLDHSLEDEVERVRRFGGELSLIFLDMDNLKDVNTNHGHAAGSRVLYEASLRIGQSIRSIDRLFRYGGDEFVILLPGTALAGAREVAERVRRGLAERLFELPSGAEVALTASAGVAACPEHGQNARRLVESADNAMREIKQRGKNAVGVAPSSAAPEGPHGA